MEPCNVLVADDEPHFREIFQDLLLAQNHRVICSATKDETLTKIQNNDIEVLLLDKRFPSDADGLEVLQRVRQVKPGVEVIVLTAFPEPESNLDAMNAGATAYLLKTDDYQKLVGTVQNLLEVIHLRKRNRQLIEDLSEKNARLEKIRATLKGWNGSLLAKVKVLEERGRAEENVLNCLGGQDCAFLALAMIHEINNRLQVMSFALELARMEPPADLSETIGHLSGMTGEIADIIGSYRELILARPGVPVPFSLGSMLEKASFLATWLCRETKVRFDKDLPPDLPHWSGFEGMMVSAFFNLLKNGIEAAQAVPAEEGPQISLRAFQSSKGTVIEVENSCLPVPPEVLPTLFDLHASTKVQGSGLGLKIAKRAIERQGGTIKVDQPSTGRFRIQVTLSAPGS